MRPLLLAGLAGAILLACFSQGSKPAAAQPRAERKVTLLFTSDLWGQLEPCGCSADMRGGLDRAAAYVKEKRAEGPVILVDAGDAFFDKLQYTPVEEPQARRKARAVAESLLAMGVEAKASFERDRVYPVEAFPRQKLLQGPRVVEAGGVKVGLLPVDATAGDPAPALEGGAKQLRKDGADVVVALIHAPRPQVLRTAGAAAKAGVDFVVGSHIDTIPEGEETRSVKAEVPVFFTQARGQSLLQIDVVLRPDGGPLQLAASEEQREIELASLDERIRSYNERIADLPPGTDASPFQRKIEELQARRRHLGEQVPQPPATGSYLAPRFVAVTEDRPADPKVKEILAAYDREVAAANLAFAKAHPQACPAAAPGEASYVGGAACAACHPAAAEFYKGTKHAHAYETLEKANKQYDLGCISCHVTGWEKPGGACSVADVEGRKDVTCESCHGPGSLHVKAPTANKLPRSVPESTCRGCHTPENSTAFDYSRYLPRILGPGHGAPASR